MSFFSVVLLQMWIWPLPIFFPAPGLQYCHSESQLREEEEGISLLSYPDLWVGDAKRAWDTTGAAM